MLHALHALEDASPNAKTTIGHVHTPALDKSRPTNGSLPHEPTPYACNADGPRSFQPPLHGEIRTKISTLYEWPHSPWPHSRSGTMTAKIIHQECTTKLHALQLKTGCVDAPGDDASPLRLDVVPSARPASKVCRHLGQNKPPSAPSRQ